MLSTPLGDVDDNVALIRRQILIAGDDRAAGARSAAGWSRPRAHAQRLRRLEAAAEQVAEGDFSTPIPDEGSDEVGQLASALNEMQQRLARLDSARREFIANASHELRTPIFSLGGFVELLDEDEPDPAPRAEFVRTMREQVDRLTKLTADLLDLSKLDADALEVNAEPVDLGELARRVAEEFWPARRAPPVRRSRSHGDGAAAALADRRSGGSDHAYPARQRAHAHAGGNLDRDRSAARGTGPRTWSSPTTAPASTRTARARLRALLHGRPRERLRASAWRSPASWPSAWTASWR